MNNVINLLINEIKVIERKENVKDLSKEKGINVAKSFLNENFSDAKVSNFLSDKEKDNKRETKEKKINEGNEEKEDEDINDDDDHISESEKKVLQFYDEKIDDYNEEYVNKKYRFCTKNCDSSLCCCGCFTPVCYQSQRHEHYINQYRSLYAVNVKINEDTLLDEDEINSKNKNSNNLDGKEENNIKKDLNNITTTNKKRREKENSLKYHAVFCINCNNHIAYFEIKEKVFHFFDVLPD
ncbi:E2F-associated phosphoprotein, putative [Plasmodium gallinaceum]|uniref:E2F-associated phosphoprotein, putative n=1 Tax=Plasmodium gallinaceum TaxID=5849 RepID=A0A1J1GQ04_PLAGA|nr:E2F-associated phosphoprotein, putative [Plasmodium gallinaceum]CRG94380.1 E2F-associated phosphoprotein, putative [Plasmodium gallinaceum]